MALRPRRRRLVAFRASDDAVYVKSGAYTVNGGMTTA